MTTAATAGPTASSQAARVFESDDSPADERLVSLLETRVRGAEALELDGHPDAVGGLLDGLRRSP